MNSERIVRGMLMNLTHNTALAGDLAQDSFVTAFERLYQFKGASRFSTWVCQIALNKYRDHLRTVRRETDDDAPADMSAGIQNSPENTYLHQERSNHLRLALSSLGQEDREIIALRYMSGYSYEIISAILECTSETARTRCFRAKSNLKKMLSNRGNNDV